MKTGQALGVKRFSKRIMSGICFKHHLRNCLTKFAKNVYCIKLYRSCLKILIPSSRSVVAMTTRWIKKKNLLWLSTLRFGIKPGVSGPLHNLLTLWQRGSKGCCSTIIRLTFIFCLATVFNYLHNGSIRQVSVLGLSALLLQFYYFSTMIGFISCCCSLISNFSLQARV